MNQSELEEFKQSLIAIQTLPVLPQNILRLSELLAKAKDSPSPRDFEFFINDPCLTAILLRTTGVGEGLSLLSANDEGVVAFPDRSLLRQLFLRVHPWRADGNGFDLVEFQRHSVGCAIISELLAERLGCRETRVAFFAGLLHDLGKLVLLLYSAGYSQVLEQVRTKRAQALPLEELYLGIGHAEAGRRLMQFWGFPQVLSDAAWLHHQPLPGSRLESGSALPLIVGQANRLCHLWDIGSATSLDPAGFAMLSRTAGLSGDDFCALFVEASRRLDGASEGVRPMAEGDEYGKAWETLRRQVSGIQEELYEQRRSAKCRELILASVPKLQGTLNPPVCLNQALVVMAGLLRELCPYRRFLLTVRLPGGGVSRWLGVGSSLEVHTLDKPGIGVEGVSSLADGEHVLSLPLTAGKTACGHIRIELAPGQPAHESLERLTECLAVCVPVLQAILRIEQWERTAEAAVRAARLEQAAPTAPLQECGVLSAEGKAEAGHEIRNALGAAALWAQMAAEGVENRDGPSCARIVVELLNRASEAAQVLIEGKSPQDEGPREGRVAEEEPGRESAACLTPGVKPDRGLQILIAEDDGVLRDMLVELLNREGYQVEGTPDGLEAIRRMIETHYDAVILDLQMPRVDGLEVLVTSRRIAPQTPVIVLTGLVNEQSLCDATAAGAFVCLRKPARNAEILEAVRSALSEFAAAETPALTAKRGKDRAVQF